VSIRRRLVLLSAGAVAAAVLVVSVVVYVSVRSNLRGQVDNALRELPERLEPRIATFEQELGPGVGGVTVRVPDTPFGGPNAYAQILTPEGNVVRSTADGPELPVTEETREVAAGTRPEFFSDETIDDTHVRVFTTPGPLADAIQIARPLTEVDATLERLLLILLAIGIGGVALGGGFGLLVARGTMGPVAEMTATAEHVAATNDLSRRLPADPDGDELARLGASFNDMLGALGRSRGAQRQLVADASHELRTPLTSVLTNVELLARLPAEERTEREAVLAAATAQLRELDVLVEDLVDLARPEPPGHAVEDVRLDALVEEAVERARIHAPQCQFELTTVPVVVRGVRPRIYRALGNLLDNAVKHGPPEGPVVVTVTGDGEVLVDDHGPGIPPAERAQAFDRFWRSDEARGLPGSGLGLAIVRHVAESHGGSVAAGEAPAGGARLTLRLPLSPTS
jgi:two-component system sensor histidine kinase MprB